MKHARLRILMADARAAKFMTIFAAAMLSFRKSMPGNARLLNQK